MKRDADRVLELFTTAVNQSGGAGRMLADRRTGWLPPLMASAYTLLLQEEEHRSVEEIADLLGVTRDEVENMLTGPADLASSKIHAAPPQDPREREHMAGGMIRHAYSPPAP